MKNDLTVLYVEDDAMLMENFKEILEDYFSSVITADNGRTAIESYNRYKPDIAILDISIPHINGLQVASKIRAIDKKIDIIMLTAYSDQEKLLQAVNLQLFAYLIKPVKKEELDKTIINLLKKYKKETILSLADNFKWDKDSEELFYNNEQIKITNKERLLIKFLCNNKNQYFKACDMAYDVLNEEITDKDCNNIVQLLSRLKNKIYKKIETDDFFIENCYGAGYKIKLDD